MFESLQRASRHLGPNQSEAIASIDPDTLTPREALSYLVAALAAVTSIFIVNDLSNLWDRDTFEAAVDALVILLKGSISAAGLYSCYKANGGVDGTQLAERVCAIAVILFVRFAVYFGLAFIAWAYHTFNLDAPFGVLYEGWGILSLFIVALFWIRLRAHIAAVAQPAKA